MPETDPLAMRHGALVSNIWAQIGEARKLAARPLSQGAAAIQLRRMRHLKTLIRKAHRLEMQRQEFSTPAIDGWFMPLEDTLNRAEVFFEQVVANRKLATAIVS